MTIIFASGGGRIGNQFINLIHLTAYSISNNTNIYKLNDNYFINNKAFPYLFFKVDSKKNRWKLNNRSDIYFFRSLKNVIFRMSVRILHFIFYFMPFAYSYKYGDRFSRVNLLKADQIDAYKLKLLFSNSKNRLTIISGWGIRDWNLVNKNINKVKKIFSFNLSFYVKDQIFNKNNFSFLFIHIRNGDFAKFDYFKDNFVYKESIWVNAINAVCKEQNLQNVVLFTDDYPLDGIISEISSNGLNILNPEDDKKNNFIESFITYASKSKAILCNSSTFSLSLAFIYHEYVYSPDEKKKFIKSSTMKLNETQPFCFNWQ